MFSKCKLIAILYGYVQKRVHIEKRPRCDFRRINSENHLFSAHGMSKAEFRRPKTERIFALCLISILLVTDDRIAHICKLHADLMTAPRDEIYHQKAHVGFLAKHLIVEFGIFCTLRESRNDLHRVGIGELFEIASQFVCAVSRCAVHDCKISLFDAAVADCLAKS